MPEPIPEVQSAGCYGGVAPIAVAAARECNTFRKVRLVQESPLFADIPPADCREVVSTARESEFSRHGTIFLEGDPIRHITLLTSGSAKVTKLGQNATRVIRGSSLLHGTSTQRLHSHDLGGQRFRGLGRSRPRTAAQYTKFAAQRLQELEARYREISTETVAKRLSHQLLRCLTNWGVA